MKKHLSYGVLLAALISLYVGCSCLTQTTGTQPLNEQPRAVSPAILTSVQTAPEKKRRSFISFLHQCNDKLRVLMGLLWLWFLARIYTEEKRRQIPGWSFDDLARLKLIKDTATRLWHHHNPHKNIIRLDDWKTECRKSCFSYILELFQKYPICLN